MSLNSLTLLYIEDDRDIQSIYIAQLEELVENVICAGDGQEGYECYLRHKPDIILLDIHMPKLDESLWLKKFEK